MKKFKFTISGIEYNVEVQSFEDNIAKIEVNGTTYEVELQKEIKTTKTPKLVRAEVPAPTRKESKIVRANTKTSNALVRSPLPGTILSISVKEGDPISIGQKLLVLEAMKMENNVIAEKDGIVGRIAIKPGDVVLQNDILLEIE